MNSIDASQLSDENIKVIPISQIQFDCDRVRKSERSVEGLKYTITDVGLMQPIIVRRTGDKYTVVDGHRRLRAMRELKIRELILCKDVIVAADETDADNKFRQIISNIQREEIDDIDLGQAFVTLKEQYGYHYKEIALIIGKTPHYVTAKANLTRRLIKDVREQAIHDQEVAKCNRDTVSPEHEPEYIMSMKVLEDIARLPAHQQIQAYNDIKAGKRKKDDALVYLRELKHCSQGRHGPNEYGAEFSVCFKKIHDDLDELEKKIHGSDPLECQQAIPALKSFLERLNFIYDIALGEKRLVEASYNEVFV
jgi:ParB family transcriptional regulator, chromosome partitioning protein